MPDPTPPNDDRPAARGKLQFGLAALLFTTVTVSILLAYGRPYGGRAVAEGALAAGCAVIVGVGVGAVAGNLGDAVFWSVLGSLFAYCCAVEYVRFDASMQYGWAAVGTVCGALAGAIGQRRPFCALVACGLLGAVIFAAYVLAMFGPRLEHVVDVVCAGVAGALLAGVVETVGWAEQKTGVPRSLLAAILVTAVLLGNIVAARWVPGW